MSTGVQNPAEPCSVPLALQFAEAGRMAAEVRHKSTIAEQWGHPPRVVVLGKGIAQTLLETLNQSRVGTPSQYSDSLDGCRIYGMPISVDTNVPEDFVGIII